VLISVMKRSWVKGGEGSRSVAVYWCSFVYMVVHGCMFCMLLFISVGYIFLLLCLFILIVTHVLFSTLTEVFPCFFLSCKANARVHHAKTGHGQHYSWSELCCSAYFLCRLCCSMYCLCVNVYCTTATGCQPNCS
jgi:hypothetical protein